MISFKIFDDNSDTWSSTIIYGKHSINILKWRNTHKSRVIECRSVSEVKLCMLIERNIHRRMFNINCKTVSGGPG